MFFKMDTSTGGKDRKWNLSANEKERLRNMTSNEAHLASLGLVPLRFGAQDTRLPREANASPGGAAAHEDALGADAAPQGA